MNGLHDQGHKRTSINELLNPVASAPSTHLDQHQQYSSNQLPGLSPSAYIPTSHQQHVAAPPSYPQQIHPQGSSFSLRAASWDHRSQESIPSRSQESSPPSSCRYAPPPQPVNSHPVYPEQYSRPARQPDEPSNYTIDVPPWPNSHEPPHTIPYPHPVVAPIYTDERTAIHPEAVPVPITVPKPSPHPDQQHTSYMVIPMRADYPPPHFDQEMQPHPYPPNVGQSAEKASLRLAARGPMPMPTPMQHLPPPQHRVQAHAYYPAPVAFAAIPVMPAPPPPKRPIEVVDDEPTASKAKKSRTKAKPASEALLSSSRRGYNAKKRSEAAQIAAQNALVPMLSFAHMPIQDKGKDKAPDGTAVAPEVIPQFHPELQFARCMSNRYRSEEFPRCVSCTRRWAGDTCRFQGIRFFLKDDKRNIVGISFVESYKPDGPSMNFPHQWNIPLKDEHIRRVKRTVALALLPVLKQELEHLQKSEVIRRPRESEVRATCDTCMTSIFSCSWMCRLCGREACAECFEQVRELTTDRVGADEAEIAALQARREKHAHVNPFFLSCTRRNEHRARDFSPMSRFSKDELSQAISEMDALLSLPDQDPIPKISDEVDPALEEVETNGINGHASTSGSNDVGSSPSRVNGDTPDSAVPRDPSSFSSPSGSTSLVRVPTSASPTPSHPVRYFTDAELTEDLFRQVWVTGDPLVVTGLLPRFKLQWTPEYFRSKYSAQSCLILECQTDRNNRVTVGEFFSWFGNYEGRHDCWKLKDWPPSADFKTSFPELYEDFNQATPIPNYVRRDGVLNIASHFPSNTVSPDLGPKMYNAMASFESQGSKGTTRLHMDMSDAVNIMLYSANTPDGRPGSAAWDLFRSEDSPKIRKFLKKKFKGQYQHDPIHSQQFYLDTQLRKELYDDYGVQSSRIYQKPGEAIFIPAGSAHQVCNLADCIKVACDFVSPEHIDRCEMLTKEFREQNQSMAWKEDVLQLRTMMWFAWLSCCRQEKESQN